MAETISIPVANLKLDLKNFRTMPQLDEVHAVQTMVSIKPEWFWALMESLLDDGYLPTENILVLKSESKNPELIVKEGNRRIAALKLIHGYLQSNIVEFPDHIQSKISSLPAEWQIKNTEVPCAIYNHEDAIIVDRIVTLAHGKGEQAGRDTWTAVARARHNRDANKISEPALDLLEKYLKNGKNVTEHQIERWSGDYPLTVLDEAIKRIATRFGATNAPDLARKYPSVENRDVLETILRDIGLKIVRFETIRDKSGDFTTDYDLPATMPLGPSSGGASQEDIVESTPGRSTPDANKFHGSQSPPQSCQNPVGGVAHTGQTTSASVKKMAAVATGDPKAVKRSLKRFKPLGNNRQKVVTLRVEAMNLTIEKNPLAFCFLLRSMFEISAKAYCDDHKVTGGPSFKKTNGQDKHLVEVLREIVGHLTGQSSDKAMVKLLHGAMTELAKPEGILSVTSMNQLVHNPSFSVLPSDISLLFGNVFPLIEAMNQ